MRNIGIGIKLVNPAQDINMENIRMKDVTHIGLWNYADSTGGGLSNPGNVVVNGIRISLASNQNYHKPTWC